MIEIPLIMGGSWFNSGEAKLRSRYTINIINNSPNTITSKICKDLSTHLSQNEGCTVNASSDPHCEIVLLDENTFRGDKHRAAYVSFEDIEVRILWRYQAFVNELAIKYVEEMAD
jgi:hypothetical protein